MPPMPPNQVDQSRAFGAIRRIRALQVGPRDQEKHNQANQSCAKLNQLNQCRAFRAIGRIRALQVGPREQEVSG